MRKLFFTAVLLCALSVILPATLAADENPRMINIQPVIKAYGFQNGKFSAGSSIIEELPFEVQENVGSIEGDEIIDTPEEFVTAAWLSPVKIEVKDPNAMAVINKELPPGKEGALKLCSMWMEKRAVMRISLPEDSSKKEKMAKYDAIINTLMQRQGITENELKAYYLLAIINAMATVVRDVYNTTDYTTKDKKFRLNIKRLIDGYEIAINDAEVVTIKDYAELSKYGLNSAQINEIKSLQFPVDAMTLGQYKLLVTTFTDFLIDFFVDYPNNTTDFKLLAAIPYLYVKHRRDNDSNMRLFSPAFVSICMEINKNFKAKIFDLALFATADKTTQTDIMKILPQGFEKEICVPAQSNGPVPGIRQAVDTASQNFPYTPKDKRQRRLY
jgi:hypothetical protein